MKKERDSRRFWNRYAKLYDFEILRFSGAAYQEMYRLMAASFTKEMKVLEIATGTGLIATHISGLVQSVEAVDYSPGMIEMAKKKGAPANVHFSVEDATALPFADHTFDAVIISNALHIIPKPETVLANIKRVLKPNGLLIAPNYSHGHLRESKWSLNAFVLKLVGFEAWNKWRPEEYVAFIAQNGFSVKHWQVLRAAFPLVYLEAEGTLP